MLSTPQQSDRATPMQNGRVALAREDFETAKKEYAESAKYARDKFGAEDKRYLDMLKGLAWTHDYLGELSSSRELYKTMYKLSPEEIAQLKVAQVALATLEESKSMIREGICKGPEASLRMANEGIDRVLGPVPQEIPLLNALATAYEVMKETSLEEETYARIESIYRETEGEQSVGMARTQVMLAQMYQRRNKPQMAQKCFNEAIAIYKEVLGKDSSQKVNEVVALSKAQPQNDKKATSPQDMTVPEF